jgi:hypothetical protein
MNRPPEDSRSGEAARAVSPRRLLVALLVAAGAALQPGLALHPAAVGRVSVPAGRASLVLDSLACAPFQVDYTVTAPPPGTYPAVFTGTCSNGSVTTTSAFGSGSITVTPGPTQSATVSIAQLVLTDALSGQQQVTNLQFWESSVSDGPLPQLPVPVTDPFQLQSFLDAAMDTGVTTAWGENAAGAGLWQERCMLQSAGTLHCIAQGTLSRP